MIWVVKYAIVPVICNRPSHCRRILHIITVTMLNKFHDSKKKDLKMMFFTTKQTMGEGTE